jgi:ribonuclease HII
MEGILSDIGPATNDNFQFERALRTRGYASIAGSDEAGRGPLAGPVVAAAVILPPDCPHSHFLDSKKISHNHRLRLYALLKEIHAAIGIGVVSSEIIDTMNILQASLLAMKRAIADMGGRSCQPDIILVDGLFEIPLSIPQITLIKGESKSASIAAASIVAKVERDELMVALDRQYPVYNFQRNKGYPTKEHRLAVAAHGPCASHRKTFRGVREFV